MRILLFAKVMDWICGPCDEHPSYKWGSKENARRESRSRTASTSRRPSSSVPAFRMAMGSLLCGKHRRRRCSVASRSSLESIGKQGRRADLEIEQPCVGVVATAQEGPHDGDVVHFVDPTSVRSSCRCRLTTRSSWMTARGRALVGLRRLSHALRSYAREEGEAELTVARLAPREGPASFISTSISPAPPVARDLPPRPRIVVVAVVDMPVALLRALFSRAAMVVGSGPGGEEQVEFGRKRDDPPQHCTQWL